MKISLLVVFTFIMAAVTATAQQRYLGYVTDPLLSEFHANEQDPAFFDWYYTHAEPLGVSPGTYRTNFYTEVFYRPVQFMHGVVNPYTYWTVENGTNVFVISDGHLSTRIHFTTNTPGPLDALPLAASPPDTTLSAFYTPVETRRAAINAAGQPEIRLMGGKGNWRQRIVNIAQPLHIRLPEKTDASLDAEICLVIENPGGSSVNFAGIPGAAVPTNARSMWRLFSAGGGSTWYAEQVY